MTAAALPTVTPAVRLFPEHLVDFLDGLILKQDDVAAGLGLALPDGRFRMDVAEGRARLHIIRVGEGVGLILDVEGEHAATLHGRELQFFRKDHTEPTATAVFGGGRATLMGLKPHYFEDARLAVRLSGAQALKFVSSRPRAVLV